MRKLAVDQTGVQDTGSKRQRQKKEAGSSTAASSSSSRVDTGPRGEFMKSASDYKTLLQVKIDQAESTITVYEMQKTQSWFSRKNLKAINAEMAKLKVMLQKLTKFAALHSMSSPETFESQPFKTFKDAVVMFIDDNPDSEIVSTMEMLRFKGLAS